MATPLNQLRRPSRAPSPQKPPLAQAKALIVDRDWATGTLLRACLEQDYGAEVEIAATYEDALDHLGNAGRPTLLVMLDTHLPGLESDALMLLLRQHKARIHVTLHGATPPEHLPFPDNFVGAAAYTHHGTSTAACAAAESVVGRGLTVHDIIDRRRIPATLDWQSATAIYSAEPGQPFPLTVRI